MLAKMTLSTKVAALVVVATLGVILTLVLINRSSTETAATGGGSALVRPDSHRLSIAPDGKVTVVEFLDFECEVCGAAFACGMQAGQEPCWCASLAALKPVPGRGCLCRACLERELAVARPN